MKKMWNLKRWTAAVVLLATMFSATVAPAATTIVTRAGKGQALTYAEMDANIINLKATADASQPAAGLTSGSHWQKLPGGMIVQWGTVGIGANFTQVGIPFPTAFSTNGYNVIVTVNELTTAQNMQVGLGQVTQKTPSTFTLRNYNGVGVVFDWLAIGY